MDASNEAGVDAKAGNTKYMLLSLITRIQVKIGAWK
jgi:hypothetical protein